MWKNIICLIVGALMFSLFANQPIFAATRNFSSTAISISTRELAIFDRAEGTVYYYNKQDGKILRVHKVGELGTSMSVQK